ncbi:MAG: DUF2283 domain-containing protein [bacterium]
MNDRYLEITYRKGRMIAAYLYLPRQPREKVKKTSRLTEGILVDYGKEGRPIGVEITAPKQFSLEALNQIVAGLSLPPFTQQELAPLFVA